MNKWIRDTSSITNFTTKSKPKNKPVLRTSLYSFAFISLFFVGNTPDSNTFLKNYLIQPMLYWLDIEKDANTDVKDLCVDLETPIPAHFPLNTSANLPLADQPAILAPIVLSPTIIDVSTCGASDGSIVLTTSGGTPEHTYIWEDLEQEAIWTFENTTDDISGNGHNATATVGSISYDTDSREREYSAYFDGGDFIRYSEVGGFLSSATTEATLSLWIKPEDFIGTKTIFEQGSGIAGLALRMNEDTLQAAVANLSTTAYSNGLIIPTTNTWIHVALVFDHGDITIFANGTASPSIASSIDTIPASIEQGGIGATRISSAFGDLFSIPPTGNFFRGWMDNVRYSNRALNQQEIIDEANNNGERYLLSAGTYTVRVLDEGVEETIASFVVGEPEVSLDLSADSLCVSSTIFNLDGESPGGGVYSGAGVSGVNFDASVAGIGQHIITYDAGCNAVATDTILVLDLPGTALSISRDSVCANAGLIRLFGGSPLGGTYSGMGVSGGNFDPSAIYSGTSIITYTYTDDFGCSDSAIDSIHVFPPPNIDFVTTTPPSACGLSDASLTINASGGTGLFRYRINGGLWSNSNIFSGLSAGAYIVEVRNRNGPCKILYSNNPVIIDDPTAILAEINLPSSVCAGETASFTAQDAGIGATYNWNFGANANPLTASGIGPIDVTFNAIGDQNIVLEVTSGGCSNLDGETFVVTGSLSLMLDSSNVSCFGGNDGMARLRANSTALPISYAWSTGDTTDRITNLVAGVYGFTISDDGGCLIQDSVQITEPSEIQTDMVLTHLDCFGDTDGEIDLEINGGTPAYSVLWSNGSTSPDQTGLSGGTYIVTVTDNNNCTFLDTAIIQQPDSLTLNGFVTDVGSLGGTDGAIDLFVSGGTPIYTYLWSNGAISQDISGLSAGTYSVVVTDNKGCTASKSFEVIELIPVGIIIKTVSVDSSETGGTFTYTLTYGCAGTTGDCNDVVLTDTLPPYLEFISYTDNINHSSNTYYNAGDRVVVFELNKETGTGLLSGSSGQVSIDVRFVNGITPDTVVARNQAQIFSSNGSTGVSERVDVEAVASEKWDLEKTLFSESNIYLDVPITYALNVKDNTNGAYGGLDVANVNLIDSLPAGVTFVSATGAGVYDAAGNTVSWNLGDLLVVSGSEEEQIFYVTVIYPSTNFAQGARVDNVSCLTGDPLGEATNQVIGKDTESTVIGNSVVQPYINKVTEGASRKSIGDEFTYGIYVRNDGTSPLHNFVLTDTFPPQIVVNRIKTGQYTNAPTTIHISYQTNLNATWTAWVGSPYNGSLDQDLYVSALGLAAGEYLTMVQYDYGTVYPGFANDAHSWHDIDIFGTIINPDHNGNPVLADSVFTNCAQVDYVYGSAGSLVDCSDVTLESADVIVTKSASNNNIQVNDTFSYYLAPYNSNGFAVDNFILQDDIPAAFNLSSINTGVFNAFPAINYTLRYQSDQTSGWIDWPGSPFTSDSNNNLSIGALGLAAGDYITSVQWDFGTVPPWFTSTSNSELRGDLLAVDRNGVTLLNGDVIQNCGDLDAQYLGATISDQDCESIDVVIQDPAALEMTKIRDDGTIEIYSDFDYIVYPENTGGVALDSFIVIDTIPVQMEFRRTEAGGWSNAPLTNLYVRYQTNLNSTWRDWTGTPFDGSGDEQLFPSDLPLLAGERVTILMWDFGSVPAGFTHDGNRPRVEGYLLPVDYNGDTVRVNDLVYNCAYLTGKNGSDDLADSECASVTVRAARAPSVYLNKYRSNSSRRIGENFYYHFSVRNNGGTPLDTLIMVDTIPAEMDIAYIRPGLWSNEPDTDLYVRYQTNLNSTWRDFPNAPFDGSDNSNQLIDSLYLPPGEYVTILQWDFGSVPFGFREINRPRIYGSLLEIDRNGNEVKGDTVVNNCAYLSGVFDGVEDIESDCETFDTGWKILQSDPHKQIVTASSGNQFTDGPYAPGDTVEYEIKIENDYSSQLAMPDPIAMDLLPNKLIYVPGSWVITDNPAGAPSPIFEQIPNYAGTGQTLLRWSWSGPASFDLPRTETIEIRFKVVVAPNVYAGETIVNEFFQVSNYPGEDCDEQSFVDINDLDGDGDVTDIICHDDNHAEIYIGSSASIQSEKLVKGQRDLDYSKFPDVGQTTPGGIADYQLFVKNTGTIPMDEIIVVDILPYVGDEGVINPFPRYSRWRPNLAGPVTAPPGITVFYSTSSNPCRSAEGIVPSGPVGCETPGWTTAPPTDITTVQSLKFDFGATVLEPGDELLLEWPMRAPVNALDGIGFQPDSIAWNSFGYIASRTDDGSTLVPSEPVKVGIKIETLVPGVYGDFVWLDINKNGIQNFGEPGLDGIRVELYEDNGDGITDPGTDNFIGWTLSANGGLYLFSDLPDGDYYAVFYKPFAYELSPADSGVDDAIDSDGIAGTYFGFPLAFAPVTHIDSTQLYLDWDMGFYPSVNASVGDYVWNDINANGIQDEPLSDGINGITVNLYDNANPGVIYATTTTQNDPSGNPGFYFFDAIPTQNYFVEFELPLFASFTTQGTSGSSDPEDSDADLITGRTETFTSVAGVYDDTWDAGMILPSGNLTLGNKVWYETDNDGIYEPSDGELGINGVRVNLYVDVDANNAYTPGTDVYFKTTTTYTSGGLEGNYLFTDLPAADYIVQIDPINFLPSGNLSNWVSTSGNGIAPDPDDDVNNDDNGEPLSGHGVVSRAITLTEGGEPTSDGDSNLDTNLSLDFGFTSPCEVSIDAVATGSCIFNACEVSIEVDLSWNSPPAGELLSLQVGDSTVTIDPSLLSSPQTISVNIPNDGSMTNDTILLSSTLVGCVDTTTFVIPQDTEAPSFTPPADTTINCQLDITNLNITGRVLNVLDNCSILDTSFVDDTSLSNNCGGIITRTWTISDHCGNSTDHDQIITQIDSIAPVFSSSSPADTIINDCDTIPEPVLLSASDNCDATVGIGFEEIAIYHPSSSWKSSAACNLLYAISDLTCDDQGTPVDATDDTISFNIAVIGQNTGSHWVATINAMPYSGEYNQVYQLGGFPANALLNFTIQDQSFPTCTVDVTVNPSACD